MLATLLSILATLLFFGLISLILVIIMYNHLHGLFDRCSNAFRQLDRHLERRSELISPLVRKLKTANVDDRASWETVVEQCSLADAARQKAAESICDPEAMSQLAGTEQALSEVIHPLVQTPDVDPQPEEGDEVAQLKGELRSVSGRILFATEAFNDFAEHYNSGREQFPTHYLASSLGFDPIPLLEMPGDHKMGLPDEVKP